MSLNDQQQLPFNDEPLSINDLPNELLPLIFKHLEFRDLNRCRMVSGVKCVVLE